MVQAAGDAKQATLPSLPDVTGLAHKRLQAEIATVHKLVEEIEKMATMPNPPELVVETGYMALASADKIMNHVNSFPGYTASLAPLDGHVTKVVVSAEQGVAKITTNDNDATETT